METSAGTRASISSSELARARQDDGSQQADSSSETAGFRPLTLNLPDDPSLREEMLPYTGEAEPDMKKFQGTMPTSMAIAKKRLEEEMEKIR